MKTPAELATDLEQFFSSLPTFLLNSTLGLFMLGAIKSTGVCYPITVLERDQPPPVEPLDFQLAVNILAATAVTLGLSSLLNSVIEKMALDLCHLLLTDEHTLTGGVQVHVVVNNAEFRVDSSDVPFLKCNLKLNLRIVRCP